MLAVSAQNNRPKENECGKHMLQITFSGKDRLSQRAKEPLPTGQGGRRAGNRPEPAGISRLFDVGPSQGLGAAAQGLELAVSRIPAGWTGRPRGLLPREPRRSPRAEERVGPEGVFGSAGTAIK